MLKRIKISGSNNKRIDYVQVLDVGPLKDTEKIIEYVNVSSFSDI